MKSLFLDFIKLTGLLVGMFVFMMIFMMMTPKEFGMEPSNFSDNINIENLN